MSLEGEIVVTLAWDGRRVRRAGVRSSRPLAVPRVLAGRDVREAAAMVPLLYSVCANAQGAAAASALEVASGREVPAGLLQARTLAVALEALQEDLRSLLIDLPAAAGVPGAVGTVAEARKAIAPMLAALHGAAAFDADGPAIATDRMSVLGEQLLAQVDSDVLGMRADAFVAIGEARQFVAWSQRSLTAPALVVRQVLDAAPGLGASDVRTMPKPTPAALAAAVLMAIDADADYARAPCWSGEAVETGAFARCRDHPGLQAFVGAHGNGVAARLLARLLEVARVVIALVAGHVEPRIAAWSPNPGEGVAAVDTARGLLLHRARVADGRVAGYSVVAPTEWNFHPDGALARGLAGLVADDEQALVRSANLVVQALDPCVAFRVEVAHA
jgi:Ni,Fe-hydrogenase I large subunit